MNVYCGKFIFFQLGVSDNFVLFDKNFVLCKFSCVRLEPVQGKIGIYCTSLEPFRHFVTLVEIWYCLATVSGTLDVRCLVRSDRWVRRVLRVDCTAERFKGCDLTNPTIIRRTNGPGLTTVLDANQQTELPDLLYNQTERPSSISACSLCFALVVGNLEVGVAIFFVQPFQRAVSILFRLSLSPWPGGRTALAVTIVVVSRFQCTYSYIFLIIKV